MKFGGKKASVWILLAGLLVGFLFVAGRLFFVMANVPDEVNFQGKLTDANGVNVTNGTYDFQVRVYDHATNDLAPNLLYTQSVTGVLVTNGIFNLKFSPPASALSGGDRYLQVCFDSNAAGADGVLGCGSTATATGDTQFDKRFLPRKLLRSNPYSLISKFLGTNYIQGGSGAESGSISFTGNTGVGVSAAGSGKIYYDSSLNKFRCSQNGAAYVDCVGGGGGGGTVTQVDTGNGLTGGPITTTGTVSINSPTCSGTDKLQWNGTAFVCAADVNTGFANPMTTLGDIIYGGASGTPTRLAGASGFLKSTGAAAPTWSAVNLASADVTGSLGISNGGTNGTATPTAGAVSYGTGTAYAFSAAGTAGQFLISGGTGAPTWTSSITATSVPFSGITAATNTTAAMVVGTGASLNFTGSGTINASSLLGGTWAIPGAIGSTTPNTGVFTDLTANGTITFSGVTSVAGNEILLTDTSGVISSLADGNAGQILTTDGTGNLSWIDVGGTGTVTQINTGNGLTGGPITTTGTISISSPTCSGTDKLQWNGTAFVCAADVGFTNPMTTLGDIIYGGASGAPTRLAGAAGFLKSTGAAAPTWSAVNIASADITGVLPIANGGTNGTASPTAGAVAYGTGSAYAFSAAGTAGQFLISGGTGAPTWTSTVTATSVLFSGITSATNTTATMVVGTGGSLNFSGSGTINASTLLGSTWASPGAIGSTTPNTGTFTDFEATGTVTLSGITSVAGNEILLTDTSGVVSSLADGTTGQVLSTDGTGGLTWVDAATGTVTGTGAATRLAFWSGASSLTSDADLFWDDTNDELGVNVASPSFSLDVGGIINTTSQYNIGGSRFAIGDASVNTIVGLNAGAANTGFENTFIGDSAGISNGSGSLNTFIGYLAGGNNTNGNGNTAIGDSAGATCTASCGDNTFIGRDSGYQNTGSYNIYIGRGADGGAFDDSVAIGTLAKAGAAHQFVVGSNSSTHYLTDFYFGSGIAAPTPQNIVFNASGGQGSNINGAAFTLAGGRSTGSGTGGSLIFQTTPAGGAGASLNTSTTRLTIDSVGAFSFGAASSTPSVSGADQGKIYYDAATDKFKCSESTGAYFDCFGTATVSFSGISSGTNTTAAMVVGTGASLNFTGSGTINASSLLGGTWAIPGAIGSTTPNTGAFTDLSANGTVTFSSIVAAAGNQILLTDTSGVVSSLSDGGPGQFLSTNGAGVLSWVDGGTLTGTGNPTEVAFWTSSNSLSSDSSLYWDNTNKFLGIGGTPLYALQVQGTNTIANFGIADTGLYIGSTDEDKSFFATGAAFDGVDWIQKALGGNSTIFEQRNNAFRYFTDSGITQGDPFSPTQIAQLDSVGFYISGTFQSDDLIHTPGNRVVISNSSGEIFNLADGSGGQVLTTDGSGNLSWIDQNPGTIDGSGTADFLARWTPDSDTLGTSLIYDNGTTTAIGTTSTNAARLTVPWLSGDSTQTMYVGSTNGSNNRIAIRADSFSNNAIFATSSSGITIDATSSSNYAVRGISTSLTGVYGQGEQNGVQGQTTNGIAGRFSASGSGMALVTSGGNIGLGSSTSTTARLLVSGVTGNSSTSSISGTVSVTNGSTTVTGSGTSFTTQLREGDTIYIAGAPYEIDIINNNTSLDLTTTYSDVTASGLAVRIDINLLELASGSGTIKASIDRSGYLTANRFNLFGTSTQGVSTSNAGSIYFDSSLLKFRCSEDGGAYFSCFTNGAVGTIGTIDSQSKSANGGVIASNTLYFQTADASFPGLVSTGTQTFAGAKTFSGNLISNANTTLGDATSDTITFTGRINSDLIPSADNTYDIGSTSLRWKTLHVGPGSVIVHNDATNTLKGTFGFSGSTAQLITDAATPLQLTTGANTGIFITTGGFTGINTNSGATALDVNGAFSMREMSAPATSPTDQGRFYFDATANKFLCSEHNSAYFNCFNSAGAVGGTGANTQVTYWTGTTTQSGDNNFTWNSSTRRLSIGPAGSFADLTITQAVKTSGTNSGIIFTGAAHTGQASGLEVNDINFNLSRTVTFLAGGISNQRAMIVTPPTYAFASSSTITDAATLGVSGAPIGGSNATLTSSSGIRINSNSLSNVTSGYGLYIDAPTGATNNYAAYFNGRVGIVDSSPSYSLDVSRLASSGTQVRFGVDGTDVGGYLTSDAEDNAVISGGASFDGEDWIAKFATSSQVDMTGGYILFKTNSGLTPGNAFTPTQRMSIDPTGHVHIASASTQVRFGSGLTDDGGYLISQSASQAVISGGASHNGTNWVAKSTTAEIISMSGGAVSILTDTGLTAGNTFTPTGRVTLLSSGNFGIGDTSPAALLTVGNGDLFQVSTAGAVTSAALTSTGTILLNANAGTNTTSIGQGTTTGAIGIGSGSNTVQVNSSNWDVSTAGVFSGLTGLTSANGTVSLNATSGANVTNIGTGTTTGAVTLGGGSNNVVVSSSTWDITGAGVASGLTGITTTGVTTIQVAAAAAANSFALCHPTNGAGTGQAIQDCTTNVTADYMEMYPVDTSAQLGDILVTSSTYVTTNKGERMVKLVKSSGAYSTNVIGIMSDKANAGDFNSIGYTIEEWDNPQPVALNGRVYINMDQSSPALNPGDLVTTSPLPGKGMKAQNAGFVVGKALESWSPGQAQVMVFVYNAYYNPSAAAASSWSLSGNTLSTNYDVDVNGALNVNSFMVGANSLTIASNGNLTTIGTITSTNLTVNALLKAAQARIGELKVDKFKVSQTPTTGDATIGSGTITAGQTNLVINNTNITANSKIFITVTSKKAQLVSVINKIPGTSFEVEIENIQLTDVNFDYWIIGE